MPEGKPAGVRCIHLTEDHLCGLFQSADRPAVCINLTPEPEMCGGSREEAVAYLTKLEELTKPEV